MRHVIFIVLTILSFNICIGQNPFLSKRNNNHGNSIHVLENRNVPQLQLRNNVTEQLDSTQRHQWSNTQGGWVTSETHYYTYTNDHQYATESIFFFDLDDGERYYGRQEEYFYNELGKWDLHYRNFLDPASGEWERSEREELFYNAELQGTEWIRSLWDDVLNQFVYVSKLVFSYTPSNKYQGYVHYSWDGNMWKEAGKEVNEYNSNDSILITNIYTWNDSAAEWQLNYRVEYFYTNDTRLDSIIESSASGSGLDPYSKIIVMNNVQGLPEIETYYLWDGSTWNADSYNAYQYDFDGNLIASSYFEWDSDGMIFIEDYREEYTYTFAGDPQSQTYSEYDEDAEALVPFFRTETFFDEDVDGNTIVWPTSPDYLPVTWHHKPIYEITSLYHIDQWYAADTTLFFYGDITTSTISLSQFVVNVFPNPSKEEIYIQMERVDPDATMTLFDPQGRLIISTTFQANHPVDISRLLPGAYTFIIRNGTELCTGKFLKE